MSSTNVLIIEDESLILYSIKKALASISNSSVNRSFNIRTAKNCDTALDEINNAVNGASIDLVLLNIDIPPSNVKELIFIEDLAINLKKKFPKVKTIVFASHCKNHRVNTVLKTLNPESFLIKSDIDFKELIKAIDTVLLEPPYYSKVILRLLRCNITNDFVLDKIDRLILYYLSIGTKMKDLPHLICLSKGAVERRKRLLKVGFNVENGNDQLLLKRAEEDGFI